MDKELSELLRGPLVKFRRKTAVRHGYIVTDHKGWLTVWSGGKLVRVTRDQIVFRKG